MLHLFMLVKEHVAHSAHRGNLFKFNVEPTVVKYVDLYGFK